MDLPDKSGMTPLQPTQRPHQKPVISGVVKVKRPATRRFLDFVFTESPKAVAAKIGRDLLVPRAKVAFLDAANGFLSGMLLGPGSTPMNFMSTPNMRGGGVNYQSISAGMTPMAAAMAANQPQASPGYEDLVCPSQHEAEVLLANMFALLNQYQFVTVGDLKEMANTSTVPSDNHLGWKSLEGARISYDRNGYKLELPRPALIG